MTYHRSPVPSTLCSIVGALCLVVALIGAALFVIVWLGGKVEANLYPVMSATWPALFGGLILVAAGAGLRVIEDIRDEVAKGTSRHPAD